MVLPCEVSYPTSVRHCFTGSQAQHPPQLCVSWCPHCLLAIVPTVREAARLTNLLDHGYNRKCIGAHSLRASEAMAMKLNGVDAETIKKVGRWMSSTFLIYIYSQIAALNAGLAQQMVNPLYFQNIGG
jgi:hypothetical protein